MSCLEGMSFVFNNSDFTILISVRTYFHNAMTIYMYGEYLYTARYLQTGLTGPADKYLAWSSRNYLSV